MGALCKFIYLSFFKNRIQGVIDNRFLYLKTTLDHFQPGITGKGEFPATGDDTVGHIPGTTRQVALVF